MVKLTGITNVRRAGDCAVMFRTILKLLVALAFGATASAGLSDVTVFRTLTLSSNPAGTGASPGSRTTVYTPGRMSMVSLRTLSLR